MGLQTSVNTYSPIGTEGAKASSNPIAAVIAANGALVADPVNGLNVGRFAWVSALATILTNYAPGGIPTVPDGFIMLEMQANNANLLAPNGISPAPRSPHTTGAISAPAAASPMRCAGTRCSPTCSAAP